MPARGGDCGVPPDLGVQVGMNVHKTGGDELAFGIDGPFGRSGHRTDFSDAVALDGNIRMALLTAGTVDDGPVFNDDIVGHGSSLCGSVRFSNQFCPCFSAPLCAIRSAVSIRP